MASTATKRKPSGPEHEREHHDVVGVLRAGRDLAEQGVVGEGEEAADREEREGDRCAVARGPAGPPRGQQDTGAYRDGGRGPKGEADPGLRAETGDQRADEGGCEDLPQRQSGQAGSLRVLPRGGP